ncbi:MAG: RNA polymerase subunit sigma-70 [Rhodobiaceae bacterium]|nr:RNA polymerase subunit sigma-70 [Rhodobiaceae bacterium]
MAARSSCGRWPINSVKPASAHPSDTGRTVEAVARNSFGRLLAYLASRTGDVAAAEDALGDAFAAALEAWPREGIPANPEGWLATVARRRWLDTIRRQRTADDAVPTLGLIGEEMDALAIGDDPVPDRRLALMFAASHPAIDPAARAPLILQTILGFTAARIADAFLVAPATLSQRLVRAKLRIREAGIRLDMPQPKDVPERMEAVLEAIYAVFSSGWADPLGTDPAARGLSEEGIWLGRLVNQLAPDEPEAAGLLALMLYAEARKEARRDAEGGFVPLDRQDVSLWDKTMIAEAERMLRGAAAIGLPGRYQLEAAIQSAHVTGRLAGAPDWAAIERLYDGLQAMTGSPVVAINRAVAVSFARGADAGLVVLMAVNAKQMAGYQPYWAALADLSARAGRRDDAATAYRRAIALAIEPGVKRFLERRLATLLLPD